MDTGEQGASPAGAGGSRDSARLPAEAWGAGVPPTPLTTWVWTVRKVGPVQNQLVEVPPERQPLECSVWGCRPPSSWGVTGPIKSGDLGSEAPPLPRCPRVPGSLASSSSSLQRGPGTPRPCPQLGLALLEPPVPSSGEMTGPRGGGAPVPPRPGLPNTSVGQGSGWSTPGGSKVWDPQRPGWGAGGAGEDADRDVRGRDPRP